MPKIATVFLADGFEEIEAVTPIDVLRRAGLEVYVAAVPVANAPGGLTRTGLRGITIVADGGLANAPPNPDLVVLPGGLRGAETIAASEAARDYVLAARDAGKICAAICAAPALAFGSWGLLDGRRATCHPSVRDRLPSSVRYVEEVVVVDGNIVTSRGPGTAFAFSLALVGLMVDAETEARFRREMLV